MNDEPLSDWDLEHGWVALRLHDERVSLPEIALVMDGSQKWLARYIARFETDLPLKTELMKRAALRWPDKFERPPIDY